MISFYIQYFYCISGGRLKRKDLASTPNDLLCERTPKRRRITASDDEETPIAIADETNPLSCNLCDKVFPTYRGRNAHQRIHKYNPPPQPTPPPPPLEESSPSPTDGAYDCDACGQTYTTRMKFAEHFEECAGVELNDVTIERAIRTTQCPVCKRRYKAKVYMQKHIGRSVCGESFRRYISAATGGRLDVDMSVRELNEEIDNIVAKATARDSKTFECPNCDAQFKTKGFMLRHYSKCIPDGITKVNCLSCTAVFSRKNDFIIHVRTVHSSYNNQYIQPQSKQFRKVYDDRPKYVIKRPGVYKCPKCPKTFTYNSSLGNHIKIHRNRFSVTNDAKQPNKCNMCDKSFTYAKSLTIHKRNKHMTPEGDVTTVKKENTAGSGNTTPLMFSRLPGRCLHCNITFNSKKETKLHNRMHMKRNEKPKNEYTCPECDAKFTNTNIFREHYREHVFNEDKLYDASISNFCEVMSDSIKQEDDEDEEKDEKPILDENGQVVENDPDDSNVCFVCKETFSCESRYQKHMKVHYYDKNIDRNLLKCKLCKRSSKNMRAYIAHMSWHTFMGRYECHACGEKFSYLKFYTNHLLEVHDVRVKEANTPTKYHCDRCDKYFVDEKSIAYHALCHRKGDDLNSFAQDHNCPKCSRTFLSKYRLMMHMQSNHTMSQPNVKREDPKNGDFKLTCSVCQMTFVNTFGLKRHMTKAHSMSIAIKKDIPLSDDAVVELHSCTLCTKKFRRIEQLKVHILEHDRKPNLFKCTLCQRKSVSMKIHLIHLSRGHLMQRFQNDRLKCDRCDELFVRRLELRKHLNEVHGVVENYVIELEKEEVIDRSELKDLQCHVCEKILATESAYQRHMLRHNILRCNYCSQNFESRRLLDAHLLYNCDKVQKLGNSDPFEKRLSCHVCSKPFSIGVKLQCHLKVQHNIDFEKKDIQRENVSVCDFCLAVFPSEERMLSHNRIHYCIKALACKLCSKVLRTGTTKKHKFQHFYQRFDDAPLKCERCEEAFTSLKSLMVHSESVHGALYELFMPKQAPSEECTICNKHFVNLSRHIMYHEKNQCKKCNTYFTSEILFNNHVCEIESDNEAESNVDVVEKPDEECEFCLKPYTCVYSKTKHTYNHNTIVMVGCRLCPKKFSVKGAFGNHSTAHRQQVFTDRPLRCRECKEVFTRYQDYNDHLKNAHGVHETMDYVPNFPEEQCLLCKKTFPNIYRHYKYHMALRCNKCDRYMLTHAAFRTHSCDDDDNPAKLVRFDGDIYKLSVPDYSQYEIERVDQPTVDDNDPEQLLPNSMFNFPITISNEGMSTAAATTADDTFADFSPVISSTVSLSTPGIDALLENAADGDDVDRCDFNIKSEPIDNYYRDYSQYEFQNSFLDINHSSG